MKICTGRAWKICAVALLGGALFGCGPVIDYKPGLGLEAVRGDPVERPRFTVEDEFWFYEGRQSIMIEVYQGEEDGLLVFYRPNRQEYWHYTPDLALAKIHQPQGSDRWFKPDDGRLDFPLSPGKTWERRFRIVNADGSQVIHRVRRCEVADRGVAETEAGRHDTIRILCTLRQSGSAREDREELFYAPAVGRVILSRALEGGISFRLFEFSRAK